MPPTHGTKMKPHSGHICDPSLPCAFISEAVKKVEVQGFMIGQLSNRNGAHHISQRPCYGLAGCRLSDLTAHSHVHAFLCDPYDWRAFRPLMKAEILTLLLLG
ncbi:hypothetical protein KIL84_008771 [Mauremys mutica]|uniref:Uncharacterized protein n=1 Tax=Mauremys mutica TaxID=74926 RepID=A0A9D4AZQ7_9SAUR|nr:hypothetical protein KIL84_008771 [Mauremys mutica]